LGIFVLLCPLTIIASEEANAQSGTPISLPRVECTAERPTLRISGNAVSARLLGATVASGQVILTGPRAKQTSLRARLDQGDLLIGLSDVEAIEELLNPASELAVSSGATDAPPVLLRIDETAIAAVAACREAVATKTTKDAPEASASAQASPDRTFPIDAVQVLDRIVNATGFDSGCRDLIAGADIVRPISIDQNDTDESITDPIIRRISGADDHYYTSDDEDIIAWGGADDASVSAGDGDDRVFIFDAGAFPFIVGERGGDTIHLCSLLEPLVNMVLGSGPVEPDSFADRVVIHPDVFRQAATLGGATIRIGNFDPRNDRLILRPSDAVDVSILALTEWNGIVKAGALRVEFNFVGFEDQPSLADAILMSPAPASETVAGLDTAALLASRRAPEGAMPEDLGHDDRHAGSDDHGDHLGGNGLDGSAFQQVPRGRLSDATECGDIITLRGFSTPVSDPTPEFADSRETTWRDGGDTLVHFGDGEPHELMSGGGDDVLFLFDVAPGSNIIAGQGADLIVLCSVDDLHAGISLDEGGGNVDDDPDTVVIGQDVLRNIPAGFTRLIRVDGFHPQNDRLLLPPPGGPLRIDTSDPWTTEVRYGQILIELHHPLRPSPGMVEAAMGVSGATASALLADIAARKSKTARPSGRWNAVDARSWAQARTLAGGIPQIPPPLSSCADTLSRTDIATPLAAAEEDEHDALMVTYGDGDDVVVLVSVNQDPVRGVLSHGEINTGAGNDQIFAFTSNAVIDAGAGADIIVICDPDSLATSLIGPPDGAPDLVVLDAYVFSKPITSGFVRELTVEGFAVDNDTLVLRLPQDARVTRDLNRIRVITASGQTDVVLWRWYEDPENEIELSNVVLWTTDQQE
jgi:hypothetical protein